MTAYGETADRRLYRDADRAVLGGVCAGLAGYFGLNLKVTRLLAIIAFFMAMPFAVVA
ncbi:MAG: PspC domain-containing protein, partial [Woeseiaceae bacterium]|nr:PspC domain-containing protein [Woeseiaceae bacterium]